MAEYLLIAEQVTGISAKQLATLDRISLAESALHAPAAEFGGVEFYPDVASKAAVLCARLAKNHPLPDGNKRAAYLSMRDIDRPRDNMPYVNPLAATCSQLIPRLIDQLEIHL